MKIDKAISREKKRQKARYNRMTGNRGGLTHIQNALVKRGGQK